jgi:hypothetical protein
MAGLIYDPKNSPERQHVEQVMRDTQAGFEHPGLKECDGLMFTMHPIAGRMETVPAYVVPIKNAMGHIFMLPDFVRHAGMPKGGGYQNWPHDVLHLLENNVRENVASPKWGHNYSELCADGTPETRWREGVLGAAGSLEGKTLIVCAPGPSLKTLIPKIEAARKENPDLKVLAINRAVRGIAADYVLFVERWVPEEWRDARVKELQKNATLICTPQTDYKAVREWPNDRVYFGYFHLGQYGQDKRVNHLASLDPMASTTAACAVRVGYELGAAKLILCGMDFSCGAEMTMDKAPLMPEIVGLSLQDLAVMAGAVSDGKGKHELVRKLADDVLERNRHIDAKGWVPSWKATYFYFDDVHLRDTPYAKDGRFQGWNAIRSSGGKPVQTTAEFLSYAEQLRAVCAIIESGCDGIKIVNASDSSVLRWNYMPFEKALDWRQLPALAAPASSELETEVHALYAAGLREG